MWRRAGVLAAAATAARCETQQGEVACHRYRRLHATDGSCAEACLPPHLGVCRRETFVEDARLESGRCAHLGWTRRTGNSTTAAELQAAYRDLFHLRAEWAESACPVYDNLPFAKFALPSGAAPRDCYPHYKLLPGGVCGEACIVDRWGVPGVCPLWMLKAGGGLLQGTCEDAGYYVDMERDAPVRLGAGGRCGEHDLAMFSRGVVLSAASAEKAGGGPGAPPPAAAQARRAAVQ